MGCPGGSGGEESACNTGDLGLTPGLGRCPGEGNGYPLQYSCLENPMDRGTSHGSQRVRHNYSHTLILTYLKLSQAELNQFWIVPRGRRFKEVGKKQIQTSSHREQLEVPGQEWVFTRGQGIPTISSAHGFQWRIRRKEGIHLGPRLSLEWFSAVTLPTVRCLCFPYVWWGWGVKRERGRQMLKVKGRAEPESCSPFFP